MVCPKLRYVRTEEEDSEQNGTYLTLEREPCLKCDYEGGCVYMGKPWFDRRDLIVVGRKAQA
jgi:hypothetical protein